MLRGNETQNSPSRAGASDPLVESLQAIASPNRLRLLSLLREPRTVADIELEATDENDTDRNITRQGVRHHLDKLREAGFVHVRAIEKDGRRVHEYETDPGSLYEVGEALKTLPLSPLSSHRDLDPPPTWDPPKPGVPTLTVVHGAAIGRSFPLSEPTSFPNRGWVVGRGGTVDVPLDWDPQVGEQTAEIERRGRELDLIDLRASPNRLSVNGQALERGERRTLSDGDVVGAGRTLLRFQE